MSIFPSSSSHLSSLETSSDDSVDNILSVPISINPHTMIPSFPDALELENALEFGTRQELQALCLPVVLSDGTTHPAYPGIAEFRGNRKVVFDKLQELLPKYLSAELRESIRRFREWFEGIKIKRPPTEHEKSSWQLLRDAFSVSEIPRRLPLKDELLYELPPDALQSLDTWYRKDGKLTLPIQEAARSLNFVLNKFPQATKLQLQYCGGYSIHTEAVFRGAHTLEGISSLSLSNTYLEAEHTLQVARSPFLENLSELSLDLAGKDIIAEMKPLFEASFSDDLERLHINAFRNISTGNDLTFKADQLREILDEFPALKHVMIYSGSFDIDPEELLNELQDDFETIMFLLDGGSWKLTRDESGLPVKSIFKHKKYPVY